jgi:DNA-binding PadR family transcriptional regulator
MTRFLREFEQLLLLSLIQLGDDAYTASIGRLLKQRTGRTVSPGAIYTALGRLERRGFVTSRFGDPTPERGGKRKKFYRLEGAGRTALRHTQAFLASVAADEAPEADTQ